MGSDMFLCFDQWKQPDDILKNVELGVFYRGSKGEKTAVAENKAKLEQRGAKIRLVENDIVDISSTQLRRMLAFHCAGPFLSPGVAAYIREHGLYDVNAQWKNLPMAELEQVVIRLLNPNRVAHVLGCRDTAVALAKRWGADVTDAARAGILHDITKALDAGDGADQAAMWDDFQYTASNGTLSAYWGQNYKIIYQCNEILDDLENSENKDDPENVRTKGEALFFRAYCYFNLVRAWGEVPLVTFKVEEASDANVPKTTADKIYEQIDKDLTEAEKCLPLTWTSEYTGRITWGAARSLHARTYMMRNDWDNMYDASTEVVKSGIYNLNTPVDKVFTVEGENCGESVFELQCESTDALKNSDVIGSQFCQVQGVRGAGEWDLGWGWHMGTTLVGQAFEAGDPRKDASLLYFRRSISEPVTPENTNKPYGESPVSTAMGAYFNKKAYTSPELRKKYTKDGFWVNIRIIRYPDVLLMAAEAANEKGIPGEAIDYLEQVRAHARGTDSSILPKVTSTDQSTLREAIRHERRVELALEPDRFYDLVRWGIAKEVLQAAGKNYQDKNALLPLPQEEIDKSNGVLVQNPNY